MLKRDRGYTREIKHFCNIFISHVIRAMITACLSRCWKGRKKRRVSPDGVSEERMDREDGKCLGATSLVLRSNAISS